MFWNRIKKRLGFTLTEVVVVLTIIATLAGNRMNIARTLYVSMQNQLTRHMLEGNLREVLTGDFYARDIDGNLVVEDNDTSAFFGYFRLNLANPDLPEVSRQTVANQLGGVAPMGTYPGEDGENAAFVFPISIPSGFIPLPAGDPDRTVQDNFYDLLDTIIINKDLLNGAFLMELNIRTGVILSIFYGDDTRSNSGRSRQEEFGYDDTFFPPPLRLWGNGNIEGGRGMEGSANPYNNVAYQRHQGYFGVDRTGEPAVIPLPDIVDIFDGKNAGRDLEGRVNVLYTELFIPKNTDSLEFRLDLLSDRSRTSVLNSYLNSPYPSAPTGFDVNLTAALNLADAGIGSLNDALFDFADIIAYLDGHLIYYPTDQTFSINSFGIEVGPLYNKFIWVLDCVYGNLFYTAYDHGIHKYIDTTEVDPQFIRAGLTRTSGLSEGLEVISLTTDHSHYGGELSGGLLPTVNRYQRDI
jgi:prepilin-type N-terminal cleavage/methylation domain-containing protein